MHTILLPLIFWRRGPYRSKTFYSTFAKKKRWPFTFLNLTSPLTLDKVNLTQSINKGHGCHTMVLEFSMVQIRERSSKMPYFLSLTLDPS